jgi:hypothetical protein
VFVYCSGDGDSVISQVALTRPDEHSALLRGDDRASSRQLDSYKGSGLSSSRRYVEDEDIHSTGVGGGSHGRDISRRGQILEGDGYASRTPGGTAQSHLVISNPLSAVRKG